MYSKLQYISQGYNAAEQLHNIEAALQAGCKWIQLRCKHINEADVLSLAQKVKVLCTQHGATFIVNDFVSIAAQTDADGVHVGLTDTSVQEARSTLGIHKIIGGTANTIEHVQQRIAEGCNYVGLGPFRFTTTKKKLSPILGLQGYETIMQALPAHTIPVYAIGGLEPDDIAGLVQTGVYGIAVSGIITQATDKTQMVEQLNNNLYASIEHSR